MREWSLMPIEHRARSPHHAPPMPDQHQHERLWPRKVVGSVVVVFLGLIAFGLVMFL